MSVINIDVSTFDDITAVVLSAAPRDILNLYIKNDIYFPGSILINKSVIINFIKGSSSVVALTVDNNYRHISTGTRSGDTTSRPVEVTMTIGSGIILDGGNIGGGIWMYGANGSLTLDGCHIINCSNSSNGGGVGIFGDIQSSELIVNPGTLIEGCSALSGGGVFGNTCDITVYGGTITNNTVRNTGGGICSQGGATGIIPALTINGGVISYNKGVAGINIDGGGLTAINTMVTINGGEISYNEAGGRGGGLEIRNLNAASENKSSLYINGGLIKGNIVRNFGGGIDISGDQGRINEFIITGGLITENESTITSGSNQGGGIYSSSDVIISGGTVSSNIAVNGGGIFVNAATLTIAGTALIDSNVANIIGGGIYGFNFSTVIIEENACVTGNSALSAGDAERLYGGGGAVALYASDLILRGNAEINENIATSYGGGIWTYPDFTPESHVHIEGGTVEKNFANYGGAISMGEITGLLPTLTIINGKINSNHAYTDGGGIIARGSTVSIAGSEITNNVAGRNGGGIYTDLLEYITVDAASFFSGNIAESYVYWVSSNNNDTNIYNTHVFTNRFSTFIPEQTLPLKIWVFLNAYNNYDISFYKPITTIIINLISAEIANTILHSTIINSFIGATVIIPSRDFFTDINGIVWELTPFNQPPLTFELLNPEGYVVSFDFVEIEETATVTVTEFYIDTNGAHIASPTQTILERGSNYIKTAPDIINCKFIGYKINNGVLRTGVVEIQNVESDTIVTFIYKINCISKPPFWEFCCNLQPCCCPEQQLCEVKMVYRRYNKPETSKEGNSKSIKSKFKY